MPVIGTDAIAKTRDITFDFTDSCNCRSICCVPRKQSRAYINSQIRAERFDSKKAVNGDEFDKSVSRIESFIFDYVDSLSIEKQKLFLQEMEKNGSLNLKSLKDKGRLTFKRVHKINQAVEAISKKLEVEA